LIKKCFFLVFGWFGWFGVKFCILFVLGIGGFVLFGYVISAMAHWTTRDHDSSCLRGIRSTGHGGMADNRTGIRMCNGPTPCIV
jgi:hypothetical protein